MNDKKKMNEAPITKKEREEASQIIVGYNTLFRKIGILCFGFGFMSLLRFYQELYSDAIFDLIVFLWILSTVSRFRFIGEQK